MTLDRTMDMVRKDITPETLEERTCEITLMFRVTDPVRLRTLALDAIELHGAGIHEAQDEGARLRQRGPGRRVAGRRRAADEGHPRGLCRGVQEGLGRRRPLHPARKECLMKAYIIITASVASGIVVGSPIAYVVLRGLFA